MGGNVSFTDEATGTVGMYGDSVPIPEDFPKDIPIYTGVAISGIAVSPDGGWLAFSTTESADSIVAWYETALLAEGWKKQGTYSADATTTAAFEKGDSILGVMAATSESGTIVTVSKSKQ